MFRYHLNWQQSRNTSYDSITSITIPTSSSKKEPSDKEKEDAPVQEATAVDQDGAAETTPGDENPKGKATSDDEEEGEIEDSNMRTSEPTIQQKENTATNEKSSLSRDGFGSDINSSDDDFDEDELLRGPTEMSKKSAAKDKSSKNAAAVADKEDGEASNDGGLIY